MHGDAYVPLYVEVDGIKVRKLLCMLNSKGNLALMLGTLGVHRTTLLFADSLTSISAFRQ